VCLKSLGRLGNHKGFKGCENFILDHKIYQVLDCGIHGKG
jgi:hypothetical protein